MPLLTSKVLKCLLTAKRAGLVTLPCSLDLERSTTHVTLKSDRWVWEQMVFPYPDPDDFNDRTIYSWSGSDFEPVSRFNRSLIKLVPTDWGPPTFEIDGIKMLRTERVSPYLDAANKVKLIQPRGKVVLDCCAGLGYFAAWCLSEGARQVLSFEKNPDVIWLRGLNPWSPTPDATLSLAQADITEAVTDLPDASMDAVLHDPPRFGIAGELYSKSFYDQLARVLKFRGRLFHYTGSPNRLSSGRDLGAEVSRRLQAAGFQARRAGDGILATKQPVPPLSM